MDKNNKKTTIDIYNRSKEDLLEEIESLKLELESERKTSTIDKNSLESELIDTIHSLKMEISDYKKQLECEKSLYSISEYIKSYQESIIKEQKNKIDILRDQIDRLQKRIMEV